jgi:hypothetical protein
MFSTLQLTACRPGVGLYSAKGAVMDYVRWQADHAVQPLSPGAGEG